MKMETILPTLQDENAYNGIPQKIENRQVR